IDAHTSSLSLGSLSTGNAPASPSHHEAEQPGHDRQSHDWTSPEGTHRGADHDDGQKRGREWGQPNRGPEQPRKHQPESPENLANRDEIQEPGRKRGLRRQLLRGHSQLRRTGEQEKHRKQDLNRPKKTVHAAILTWRRDLWDWSGRNAK